MTPWLISMMESRRNRSAPSSSSLHPERIRPAACGVLRHDVFELTWPWNSSSMEPAELGWSAEGLAVQARPAVWVSDAVDARVEYRSYSSWRIFALLASSPRENRCLMLAAIGSSFGLPTTRSSHLDDTRVTAANEAAEIV